MSVNDRIALRRLANAVTELLADEPGSLIEAGNRELLDTALAQALARLAAKPAPLRLLEMLPGPALEAVAEWLDDCDTHVALDLHGDLPTPPFAFSDAHVLLTLAAKPQQPET